LFLRKRLDGANQVELVDEISFCAQRDFGRDCEASEASESRSDVLLTSQSAHLAGAGFEGINHCEP
jgi:hypothetical protein